MCKQETHPRPSKSLAFQKAIDDISFLKVRPTDEEMLEVCVPHSFYLHHTLAPSNSIMLRCHHMS